MRILLTVVVKRYLAGVEFNFQGGVTRHIDISMLVSSLPEGCSNNVACGKLRSHFIVVRSEHMVVPLPFVSQIHKVECRETPTIDTQLALWMSFSRTAFRRSKVFVPGAERQIIFTVQ